MSPELWQVEFQRVGQPKAVRRFPDWGAADRFFGTLADAPDLIFAELARTRASQGLEETDDVGA